MNNKLTNELNRDKPIADAARAVENTALKASAMLDELKQGWLWSLLCRQCNQKVKVNIYGPTT
jgi:hypothetical protein